MARYTLLLLLLLGRFSVGVCKRTFYQHFGLGRRTERLEQEQEKDKKMNHDL